MGHGPRIVQSKCLPYVVYDYAGRPDVSSVSRFDKDSLIYAETIIKKPVPTQETIEQEKHNFAGGIGGWRSQVAAIRLKLQNQHTKKQSKMTTVIEDTPLQQDSWFWGFTFNVIIIFGVILYYIYQNFSIFHLRNSKKYPLAKTIDHTPSPHSEIIE